MTRLLVCRFHVRKLLRARVGVSTLLLICPAIFGQSYPGLPNPRSSGLPGSGPINIHVSELRNVDRSTVTLQELQHVVPTKARKAMEKAEAARLKNRTDEAIKHYSQAVSIDPEFVSARNNLAAIYLMTQRPEPAIAQLEAAIKTDPIRPVLFTNLAMGYGLIQQYGAAERAARVAAGLDRTGALAHLLLGLALISQRKVNAETLQCFERAQTYPVAHFYAAGVLMAQGQLKPAKAEIQVYLNGAGDQDLRAVATHWLGLIDQGEQTSFTSLSLSASRN